MEQGTFYFSIIGFFKKIPNDKKFFGDIKFSKLIFAIIKIWCVQKGGLFITKRKLGAIIITVGKLLEHVFETSLK